MPETDGIYSFAGIPVRIRSLHREVHRHCRDYAADGTPEYTITITEEDILREKNLAGHAVPDAFAEISAVHRRLAEELADRGILVMHGSAIAADGRGCLFTAPSGTGKSTHTRLWREMLGDRARMVNDDKPFLQVSGEGVRIWGSPWDGKHRLSSNISVPLEAICFLRRGPTNEIRPISPAEALPELLQQCYRPQDPQKCLSALSSLDLLARGTGFYRLSCNMEPEAAELSFRALLETR